MSDPIHGLRFDGESLSAYAQKVTTNMATGLHRWAEQMSATGRRQATAEAGRRLSDWVRGGPEWRPSRGEVKAWVIVTEDDRRALRSKVEALVKENEALAAQRDDALEDLAAERAAHDADVAELGDHRDTLKVMFRQAQCERDRLRAELGGRRNPPASAGELRRLADDGRASCPCAGGTGAK